ncbi:ATP-dependent acyl-CoA ligase [Thiomonas sp.]|uniref:ATP-dependent acyl-CoA ligase n=1 Tax=Thiomonas sp. TaxID=2047785 RepID=UPI00260408FC|nr:ATP-dependent acyl-CoA ligase [Thiomonas sp.]
MPDAPTAVSPLQSLPLAYAPAQRSLPELLMRQAERHAGRCLFVAGNTRWSYADALAVARRWAARLRAAGVAPGDRVALQCSNRPEFLQILLGCAWAGAVCVPINTASRGAQLRHMLDNSGATLFVTEPDGRDALRVIEADAGQALAGLRGLWLIDAEPDGDARARAFPRAESEPAELAEAAPVRPGDDLVILYTSGTTGLSKGVRCPHAQFFWWGVHTAELLGLGDGEILLTTLPLFHTNAMNAFFQALLTGSTLVVEPRFSASGFWPALVEHRASVTYVLGAMVPILLSRPAGAQDRAHRVRIALAPGVPRQFHARFQERFGFTLLDGYGSTETNFVIGAMAGEQRPGTMGRVRPGFDARVVDDADNPLPDGTPGELVLRAQEPFAFANGYFAMDDRTVESWRNLWFHTGDRVLRDADGYFHFIDRLKDAIRRRGENVSSYEVEQVLLSHPAVAVAAVFPVRSELAEDEVMAALVARDGERIDPVELVGFCAQRMAYFAVPRYIDVVEALPATENGKIQKFKLRERGVGAATWDRERAGVVLRRPGAGAAR